MIIIIDILPPVRSQQPCQGQQQMQFNKFHYVTVLNKLLLIIVNYLNKSNRKIVKLKSINIPELGRSLYLVQ